MRLLTLNLCHLVLSVLNEKPVLHTSCISRLIWCAGISAMSSCIACRLSVGFVGRVTFFDRCNNCCRNCGSSMVWIVLNEIGGMLVYDEKILETVIAAFGRQLVI